MPGMSPAARVRADRRGRRGRGRSGIVAGVVYATRQDPAAAEGAVQGRRRAVGRPRDVARRTSPRCAPRSARAARAAARALEPLAAASTRRTRSCSSTTRPRSSAPASSPRRTRRSATAKKVGRDTFYEVAGGRDPPPAVLHRTATRRSSRARPTRCSSSGAIAAAQGHQHSAERLCARAARLHPDDDEAQVAAAVGRFDMDDLSASFSRLGPLVKRFPHSQSVRFHLGLLLAWTGQRDQAVDGVPARPRARAEDDPREEKQLASSRGLVPTGTNSTAKMSRHGLWRPSGSPATVPHPTGNSSG